MELMERGVYICDMAKDVKCWEWPEKAHVLDYE
jgi:hypothetical protein